METIHLNEPFMIGICARIMPKLSTVVDNRVDNGEEFGINFSESGRILSKKSK